MTIYLDLMYILCIYVVNLLLLNIKYHVFHFSFKNETYIMSTCGKTQLKVRKIANENIDFSSFCIYLYIFSWQTDGCCVIETENYVKISKQ